MTVAVELVGTFRAGTPTPLFDAPSFMLDGRLVLGSSIRSFDVSRDARRFLMIKNTVASDLDEPPASIVVVQNWPEKQKTKMAGR